MMMIENEPDPLRRIPIKPPAEIHAQVGGVLRAARNLTLATLVEAVRTQKKQAGLELVNKALLQPHWRSLDELL